MQKISFICLILIYCFVSKIQSVPIIIESTTTLQSIEDDSTVVDDELTKTETPVAKIKSIVAEPKSLENNNNKDYKNIQIVSYDSTVDENGKYKYSFETDDGIITNQSGELEKIDSKHSIERVHGSYSYKDQNGETICVTYTADENGFRPIGKHIPTLPAPSISRALDNSNRKPTTESNQKSIESINNTNNNLLSINVRSATENVTTSNENSDVVTENEEEEEEEEESNESSTTIKN